MKGKEKREGKGREGRGGRGEGKEGREGKEGKGGGDGGPHDLGNRSTPMGKGEGRAFCIQTAIPRRAPGRISSTTNKFDFCSF
jgi:hypothetical protein